MNTTIICLTIIGVVLVLYVIWFIKQENERKAKILWYRGQWPEDIIEALLNKQVKIGMTMQMVRLGWGNPTTIEEKEITKTAQKIRWVYGEPRRGARYLWFTNDELTKIQK